MDLERCIRKMEVSMLDSSIMAWAMAKVRMSQETAHFIMVNRELRVIMLKYKKIFPEEKHNPMCKMAILIYLD